MTDAFVTAPAMDLATARAHAREYDLADAPLGRPAAPIRLPDHESLTGEDTGRLRFDELLAAHFHPRAPQDRIEHPWMSPAALEQAAATLVETLPLPVGRHNRYRPVPGEDALRSDDLLDFVSWYGHEYQILVFRAADVRTGAVLDVGSLTAAGVAVGAKVIWDWTGALDWVQAPPTEGVAAVFWSTHSSLLDGRRIQAGVWLPGDTSPEALTGRCLPQSVAARTARLADFAARTLAGVGAQAPGLRVVHPRSERADIPVLVLEATDAVSLAGALLDGPGFRAVVRYGNRVVGLPDSAATYVSMADRAAAAAASAVRGN
ncbi:hypothetical protein [Microbacterium album]|uniref:Aminotransferase n=1 Tax=Microbacterium album TaxID=2053191 RepID=A0A917IEX9_9MICO|nr:hypothetical protein [Microbacterium album]GGH43112.1 hypothetical protein GCM10010921_16800 [Microbacterium album]